MNNETTTKGIAPEMTIADAVRIVREEAARHTGDIRAALTMLAECAMPLIPHGEPEQSEERKEKRGRGKIGIKSSRNAILAWNIADGLDIVVSGQRLSADSWKASLTSHGIGRAFLMVFGGRQTAANLCMALRNGLTRRCMKIKSNHANRKSKEVQP